MADEQEIGSDVDAVAEPEIEAEEGSEQEPEKEPDESPAAKGDSGEAYCPIEMGVGGRGCGRPLHTAPGGVDSTPVCLMHSKDSHKQSGPLFDAFRREFERILEEAGEGDAHLDHFVFPQLNFIGRTFHAICRFEEAIFEHSAIFYGATFNQNAFFWRATFSKNAEFRCVTFNQKAFFNEATFKQHADFGGAAFKQNVDFIEATFTQDADFSETTFTQNAEFMYATFTQAARFVKTKFHGTADWRGSKFLDQAQFRSRGSILRPKGRPALCLRWQTSPSQARSCSMTSILVAFFSTIAM